MHELPYSSRGSHGGVISSHQKDKKNICFVSAILAQWNSTSRIQKTVTSLSSRKNVPFHLKQGDVGAECAAVVPVL